MSNPAICMDLLQFLDHKLQGVKYAIWPLSSAVNLVEEVFPHNQRQNIGVECCSVAADPPEAVGEALKEQGITLLSLQQVHGSGYVVLNDDTSTAINMPEADAWLWTEFPAQPLACAIYTADCVPAVLHMYDQDGRILGGALMHLGRRGIEQGLLRQCFTALLRQLTLRQKLCPKRCFVARLATGPAIGSCCYEVPQQMALDFCRVAKVSRACCHQHPLMLKHQSHVMLDLKGAIFEQACQFGLKAKDIYIEKLCTSCAAQDYLRGHSQQICYSYRQGHKSERIYTIAFFGFPAQLEAKRL